MKKTLTILLGLVLGLSLHARSDWFRYEPELRFGVHAGYVRSNMIEELPIGTKGSLSPEGGVRAGLDLSFSVFNWLELGSGLNFIGLCSRDEAWFNNVYRASYVEFPLNLRLKQSVFWLEMAIFGGVYGALGIGGSSRNEVGSYPFFGPDGIATRGDFGLNAEVELTLFGHYRLSAGYRHGLIDISNGTLANGARLYNEALVCSISYIF